VHDYGSIHKYNDDSKKTSAGSIYCLEVSLNRKKLYTGDGCGNLKEFDIQARNLSKNYGKLFIGTISFIIITGTEEYMFVCSGESHVKQICLKSGVFVEDYGRVLEGQSVNIVSSWDGGKWFLCGDKGRVKHCS
jgi:hypothetical protein